jgi:hypothetical protein
MCGSLLGSYELLQGCLQALVDPIGITIEFTQITKSIVI